MTDRNLVVSLLITAKDQASGVFNGLLKRLAGLAAGIATISFFNNAVDDAEALETQMRKLEATIKATGGAAGLSAQEISDLFNTDDNAAQLRDAAVQLLTFKSVGKDVFETTLRLADDLADAGFGSVAANAVQLGKALEDPAEGLGALSRSGVTFTESQKELIKQLVETGDKAKAQGIILEAVAGQVGGVADAVGSGLTGANERSEASFRQLREILGGTVLPALTVFKNFVADAAEGLLNLAKAAGGSNSETEKFGGFVRALAEITAGAALGIDRLRRGIGALAAKMVTLANFDFEGLKAIDEAFDEDNAAAIKRYTKLIDDLQKKSTIKPKVELDDVETGAKALADDVNVIINSFKIWDKTSTESISNVAKELQKLSDIELQAMKKTLETAFETGINKSDELAQALTAISAEEVTRAWKELGGASERSLNQAADAARKAYVTIRDSGTASSADLVKSWNLYTNKIKDAAAAINQVDEAERQRAANLKSLQDDGTGDDRFTRNQALERKNAEFKQKLREEDYAGAVKAAQEAEKLAFEVAEAEKKAYEGGDGLSFDKTQAIENYKASIQNTTLALDELAKKQLEAAAAQPVQGEVNPLSEQQQAITDLKAQLDLLSGPVALTISTEQVDAAEAKVLSLINLVGQLNAVQAQAAANVEQSISLADQINREALARGRR